MSEEAIWLSVGLFGQALFFMRFLVQWIASERAKKSIIPKTFWYYSIGGAIILFSYSVYRQDIVFILGQSLGVFIYSRNLYFLKAEKNEPA